MAEFVQYNPCKICCRLLIDVCQAHGGGINTNPLCIGTNVRPKSMVIKRNPNGGLLKRVNALELNVGVLAPGLSNGQHAVLNKAAAIHEVHFDGILMPL